jgi:cytochrome P450
MVRESFKRTTASERTPEALAYRLLLLNFASVSTSTIGATNAVLDIISAPDAPQIIAALREEAQRVLAEHGGVWTKAAVAKLYRTDSVLRESARVSGVGGTGLARRVRPENGIVLQDGTWVPKGATVGVAQGGIHFDEAYYDHPNVFDAFRFSRAREEKLVDLSAGSETAKNEDLVTTSAHFLAFSHGLHAW